MAMVREFNFNVHDEHAMAYGRKYVLDLTHVLFHRG